MLMNANMLLETLGNIWGKAAAVVGGMDERS